MSVPAERAHPRGRPDEPSGRRQGGAGGQGGPGGQAGAGGQGGAAGRREAILREAAAQFAAHGFHGVSIDDLGAALGVSGPALYRYFPGKEAILTAMLVGISEQLLDGATRVRETAGSPGDLVDALVRFHVDFALTEPDLIAVHFRDLGAVPDPDRRRVRRLQARYVETWVDAIVAWRPAMEPTVARAAAHAVFGLINSTPHSARLSRDENRSLLHAMALAAIEAA